MKWKKLGKVYEFSAVDSFISSHASNPLAVHLREDVYRVYFSGRDADNKSSIAYVDVDIIEQKVAGQGQRAVLTYGQKSSFYSHGVSIGNAYQVSGTTYILFMGWQIRNNGHWRGDIGRIRLLETGEMVVDPTGAFMETDIEDPISLSYPWVMYDEGIYKMWYGSTIDWSSENDEMIHVIKYATSVDGNSWQKHGLAVPYELGVAQAFSRPTVMKNEKGYHMWFSYRSGDGTKYRIGYAHSVDGEIWNRKSQSGIGVSDSGWDSEMICYPFVFKHKSQVYMFYNGNDFGRHGFGLALLEK